MIRAFANPKDLTDAIRLLTAEPRWRPVAGCTDISVKLRFDRLDADGFVNLWGLLPRHIEERQDEIRIGAGATCAQLAKSALVRAQLPALFEAAATLGSPQIRSRATVGGNVANASPAADLVPALMSDDARVVVQSANGVTTVALHRLFVGPQKTILGPGDLITEIVVPKPAPLSYARFDKLGFRQAQIIAAVNFAIRATGAAGTLDAVRIAWGSVAPTPVRSPAVEDALAGTRLTEADIAAAIDAVAADVRPIDDHRASAAYRLAVARSFLRRALKECQRWLST
ncbi:MAG: FAD binding domain-containing protein [Deltaproteobacteria bacterium]|nr:FAD binding domain-containing protein [Deltaproteobacteria bacterium]